MGAGVRCSLESWVLWLWTLLSWVNFSPEGTSGTFCPLALAISTDCSTPRQDGDHPGRLAAPPLSLPTQSPTSHSCALSPKLRLCIDLWTFWSQEFTCCFLRHHGLLLDLVSGLMCGVPLPELQSQLCTGSREHTHCPSLLSLLICANSVGHLTNSECGKACGQFSPWSLDPLRLVSEHKLPASFQRSARHVVTCSYSPVFLALALATLTFCLKWTLPWSRASALALLQEKSTFLQLFPYS